MPANLLLLGEYAVTEEGGLGIALASAPRAKVRVSPREGGGLAINGRMGPTTYNWVEGESEPPPLVAACVDEARAALEPPHARIDIDSSAFFSAEGDKRGFGSSAAVAVGLSAALLRLGGFEGEALEAAVFPLALAAHRRAQGGRGSGYDVAASRFGGLGLFEGGAAPRWTGLPAELLLALRGLELSLRFGPHPVLSALAVGNYQRWKARNLEGHRAFLSASAALVRDFMAATNPEELLAVLREAAEAGVALGETIGVPARPYASSPQAAFAEKCLGAGDELILIATIPRPSIATQPTEQGPTLDVGIESEGLRWE